MGRKRRNKNQPVVSKGPRMVGDVEVKEWQRVPSQILHEHTQKQKVPKPRYVGSRCDEPGKIRQRVILPDKKDKEKDLSFVTRKGFSSKNAAKEHSALLALHHINKRLPLERKLPEPYASVWRSLGKEDAAISSAGKFASQHERKVTYAERDAKRARAKNIRESKILDRKFHRVVMDEQTRMYVENVVAGSMKHMDNAKIESLEIDADPLQMQRVVDRLVRDGFNVKDAELATKRVHQMEYDEKKWYSSALGHLTLTLPEDQLPAKFLTGSTGAKGLIQYSDEHNFLFHLGFPRKEIKEELAKVGNDRMKALTSLLQKLRAGLEIPLVKPKMQAEEREETIAEELEVLGSMYEGFKKLDARRWQISLALEALMPHKLILHVFFPTDCAYPENQPDFYFHHPHLTASLTMQLIQNAIIHLHGQELAGEPMVTELVTFICDTVEPLLSNSTRFSYRTLTGCWWEPLEKVKKVKKKEKKKRTFHIRKERLIRNDPERSAMLYQEFAEQQKKAKYQEMQRVRAKLPACKSEKKIMELINQYQVVVISGDTGCGKSTQIPQFILDDALLNKRGSSCNVVCTQPRRISAIALADRVAAERADKVGATVGYNIRLDNKTSERTRLTYCTCGILLRRLSASLNIGGISHVVIDEVHERSIEIDILMKILKDLLIKRKDLKIILMSATLNAKVFSKYFGKAPVIEIPGRTFPVTQYFLEEILDMVGANLRRSRRSKRTKDEERMLKDSFMARRRVSERCAVQLSHYDEGKFHEVDLDLIFYCVRHILNNCEPGAILIFMPGAYEINSCVRLLEQKLSHCHILPLHSQLSTKEQRQVFKRPPRGLTKIVVSTNIAETSITVDDVRYVIDTGKMREVQYDSTKKLAQLVETWVSRANAIQRKGRAGRVKEGVSFHLYTSWKFKEDMLPSQLPEIHRSSLEHICLKLQFIWECAQQKKKKEKKSCLMKTIMECIEPPPKALVQKSIDELILLKALDPTGCLTPLGTHLSQLPVGQVRIGKILIYGSLFGCTEDCCALGAIMSVKSPFYAPRDKRDEARKLRMNFYSGNSDFLTALAAYRKWQSIRRRRDSIDWCHHNFVSDILMRQIDGIKRQFMNALKSIGIPGTNENAQDFNLLQSILCAGLYPNVVKVKLPQSKHEKAMGGLVDKGIDATQIRFFEKDPGGRIFLHPSSSLFQEPTWYCPYALYLEKMETSKLYMFDCTAARPYALLLFGGALEPDVPKKLIQIDKFITFEATGRVSALIEGLRGLLDELLKEIIERPGERALLASPVITAMIRLLKSDGRQRLIFQKAQRPERPRKSAGTRGSHDNAERLKLSPTERPKVQEDVEIVDSPAEV